MSHKDSNIEVLGTRLGREWPAIRRARAESVFVRQNLDGLFANRTSPDTTVVVFGSIAREKVTSSSDLDWILLVDGSSVPEHKIQEREVSSHCPYPTARPMTGCGGRFSGGTWKMIEDFFMAAERFGFHGFLSTTLRDIGAQSPWTLSTNNVSTTIISGRYGTPSYECPGSLYSPLDYCIASSASLISMQAQLERPWYEKDLCPLTRYLENQLSHSPLEIVAKACLDLNISDKTALALFDSYDRFIGILNDPDKRADLARAHTHEDLRASKAWDEVRTVSRPLT